MRILTRLLTFILLAGAFFMLNETGNSGEVKYMNYSSKNPALGITVDYVAGWSAREQSGAGGSFAQVGFYEPIIEGKPLRALMVVTAELPAKLKVSPATIEGIADDMIAKRSNFKKMQILSRSKTKAAGEQAISLEIKYETYDDTRKINPQLVTIGERVAIFKKGGKFFTARYTNIAKNFKEFSEAFDHLLGTVRLKKLQ